jgi:hypothetical protein
VYLFFGQFCDQAIRRFVVDQPSIDYSLAASVLIKRGPKVLFVCRAGVAVRPTLTASRMVDDASVCSMHLFQCLHFFSSHSRIRYVTETHVVAPGSLVSDTRILETHPVLEHWLLRAKWRGRSWLDSCRSARRGNRLCPDLCILWQEFESQTMRSVEPSANAPNGAFLGENLRARRPPDVALCEALHLSLRQSPLLLVSSRAIRPTFSDTSRSKPNARRMLRPRLTNSSACYASSEREVNSAKTDAATRSQS